MHDNSPYGSFSEKREKKVIKDFSKPKSTGSKNSVEEDCNLTDTEEEKN